MYLNNLNHIKISAADSDNMKQLDLIEDEVPGQWNNRSLTRNLIYHLND